MDCQINQLENNVLLMVSEAENDFSPERLTKIKPRFDDYLKEIDTYLNTTIRSFYLIILYKQKNFFLEENKLTKAKYLYLKGKLLDILPEYSKQAEESLSKSVLHIFFNIFEYSLIIS